MAGSYRKFAQKLVRPGSTANPDFTDRGTHVPQTGSSSCTIGVHEVVDPPDFEEIIRQQRMHEQDRCLPFVDFPDDDILVCKLQREKRTVGNDNDQYGPESDGKGRNIFNIYTGNYTVFRRRYIDHSSSKNYKEKAAEVTDKQKAFSKQDYEIDVVEETHPLIRGESKRSSIRLNDNHRNSWANSVFDLKNSMPDELLPNLLDSTPVDDIDFINNSLREASRHEQLFSLYQPPNEDDVIEKRDIPLPPKEHFGHRILVKCLQLKLELEMEPLFAVMALYDSKEKKKISENFYFDMSPEPIKKLLVNHIPKQDISTLSRSCIFSVTYPSSDIFIVVKLEKVLQPGDVAETYIKDEKNINKDKASGLAKQYCEKLGSYRMPFGWTAIQLSSVVDGANNLEKDSALGSDNSSTGSTGSLEHRYSSLSEALSSRRLRDESLTRSMSGVSSESRSLKSQDKRASWGDEPLLSPTSLDTFRPVTLTVSSFFKQETERLSDDDLYKYLADLKRSSSALKKLKCIQGTLKLDISPCPEEVKYCLSPELHKIEPYPDEKGRPTKEIVEFPARELFVPYTTYRNLLYVYPHNVNFTNRPGSARNIAVKIELMAGEDEKRALNVIYGHSSCPELLSHAYTAVSYHNRSPNFYDEIKMNLPARLDSGYHILFTFYHISCQLQKKEGNQQTESVIGYSWLPMMKDGRLHLGEFSLPVSADKPPPHYTMMVPDISLPGIKWLDNHKGLFSVGVKAVSSIHTQDEKLDHFLRLCHNIEEHKVDKDFKEKILDVVDASLEPLIKFLPLLFDEIIKLMIRPSVLLSQAASIAPIAFESMATVVSKITENLPDKNDMHRRNGLLTQYVHYCASLSANDYGSYNYSRPMSVPDFSAYNTLTPPSGRPVSMRPNDSVRSFAIAQTGMVYDSKQAPFKLVHEELALQWVVSSGAAREKALSHAWFFFELIVKSMAECISSSQFINAPRKQRFPAQFTDDCSALVGLVTKEIVDKHNSEPTYVRQLNSSLAFFIFDILSLMDRGYVFNLLRQYCKTVASKLASSEEQANLMVLKLDFLRIVSSHEHYLTLNLPFTNLVAPESTLSMSSLTQSLFHQSTPLSMELTDDFRQQHYLVGIILCDLVTSLMRINNPVVHQRAIGVVSNLLYCHDLDIRFNNPQIRAKIAQLYFPIVSIACEVLEQLWDPSSSSRNSATYKTGDGIDLSIARAISTSSVLGARTIGVEMALKGQAAKNTLNYECTRNLLIACLWVFKNMDKDQLLKHWKTLSPSKLSKILDLFFLCLVNFEYKSKKIKYVSQQTIKKSADMKSKLEDVILGGGSARNDFLSRRKTSNSNINTVPSSPLPDAKLRWRKDQTQWRQEGRDSVVERTKSFADPDFLVLGNLATEVTMVVLDMLEMVIKIIQAQDSIQNLLTGVLKVLLQCLATNQSSYVLKNAFATQRSLVTKYPELLFEESTEACADLCLHLLRHCTSSLPCTRSHAAASLYMLMRQNFERGNNFARVKMQVTMSLSHLVGHNQFLNEEYLRSSLKTILEYAKMDLEFQETTFPDQVRDLVFNLHMILSDTVKMKEFQEDPEMLIDLMYRIAKGYQTSPDLRLTWLQNMANKHTENDNHAEAAQCYVHCAGLVVEYMSMIEEQPYLPVGCVGFQKVSQNVLEESAVSDDIVSPDQEGICTGRYFTDSGLINLMELAADSFSKGGMFEMINEVYKLLIPLHEAYNRYERLATIHGALQTAYRNIISNEGRRMFGTYFRVGFYGAKFGDLDGQEYVYKEPSITKLPEIAHRLESFYGDRFGHENVSIIKDSNTVEREKLEPGKAYIQLTYVEPYFDAYELKDRRTYFEKNYNIRRFMYATPFTLDGRAHGELHEQYKRKTILTTEKAFPYVKTRITVIGKTQVILSPIEVAIEDVQKKVKEINAALGTEPLDPKILQMVLQGCIGTTVNQGPVEVGTVFLSDIYEEKAKLSRHQNKLRICFKDFLLKCDEALQRNKRLIREDQFEYQKELERNFTQVKDKLGPLISSTHNHSNVASPQGKKTKPKSKEQKRSTMRT